MAMKSTGEARPVINITIQTEINIKENRIYRVINRPFHPNFKVQSIASKFYAKHDFPDPELLDESLVDAVERWKIKLPKNRSPDPETENQEYGWYLDPLIPPDSKFHHPRIGTTITRIGAVIAKEDEKNPKKQFTGFPFKL